VDAIPHSHAYREDTILQCVAFTVARVREIHSQDPAVPHPDLSGKYGIITKWLDENTMLTTRTKQDYAKIIEVKSKNEITLA
jgi:hypothetical protein